MSNYNEMIGETCMTDGGEYIIVAHVHDDGCVDESINLYVGRATTDGHHDLIASDNASMWLVGDEDDAERNRGQWDAIAARCDVAPVLDEVHKIDGDLADWLGDRYNDARRAVLIISGDYLPDDRSDAVVVNAPVNNLGSETIAAIWDDLPNECILVQGLGVDETVAHFAPFDGNGDPSKDNRSIEGYADCKAAYYVASWDNETRDGECDAWDLYNADGTPYEEA